MSSPLHSLFSAILDDKRRLALALLERHDGLALETLPAPQFEKLVFHWFYKGDTPLHAAAAGYRVEIAKKLLALGADPNAAGNHRRSRPLHYAADGCVGQPSWDPKRQVAMLKLLMRAGADLNAQDKNGATALHRAVRTRSAGAVEFLLKAGADATMWNNPGSTPFHLAVQNTGRGGSGSADAHAAQRQIIQTFIQNRISPRLRDRSGKSVSEWAKSDALRALLQDRN